MTISEYKNAVSKFMTHFRLGLIAVVIGLINCGLAAFPNEFSASQSTRSRWGFALLGLVFFLLGYYWLKQAFRQRPNLLCPSCKDWLGGPGRDKPTSTGRCPTCGTKMISDIEERVT